MSLRLVFIVLLAAATLGWVAEVQWQAHVSQTDRVVEIAVHSVLDGSQRRVGRNARAPLPQGAYDRAVAVRNRLRQASPEQWPDLLAAWRNERDGLAVLLEHWALNDPNGMLAHFFDGEIDTDPALLHGVLDTLFREWVRTSPEEAFAAASQIPVRDGHRAQAMNTLIGELVKTDFETAMRFAVAYEEPLDDISYDALQGVIAFTEVNPKRASELIEQMPAGRFRRFAVEECFQTWAKKDPRNAMEWAEKLDALLSGRSTFLGKGVEHWAGSDLEAATEYVDGMTGRVRSKLELPLINALAEHDPEAAMARVDEHLQGSFRQRGFAAVLEGLGSEDPDRAMDLAKIYLYEAHREGALYSIVRGLRDKPPAETANLISSWPAGGWKRQLVWNDFEQWAERNVHEARRYVEQFPEGDARSKAMALLEE